MSRRLHAFICTKEVAQILLNRSNNEPAVDNDEPAAIDNDEPAIEDLYLQLPNKSKEERNLKHCLVVKDEQGLFRYAIQGRMRNNFANAISTAFGLNTEWRRRKWRNISNNPSRYTVNLKNTCLAHLVNKTTKTCQWQNEEQNWACNSCVESGKPCLRIIEYEGEYLVHWFPLPPEKREGVFFEELAYWFSAKSS